MLTQAFNERLGNPHVGLPIGAETHHVHPDTEGLRQEHRWRDLKPDDAATTGEIVISRWAGSQTGSRYEEAATPPGRYVVAIALKSTRLTLTRGRQVIFDGVMPAGTLHVTAPSTQLGAQFHAPYDFLHFHVSADYLRSHRAAAEPCSTGEDLGDLILLRDPFAEQLGRALIERGNARDPAFTHCIGQTLAMHIARLETPRSKVNALPKWRLRRVEEYVNANYHRTVSLADLAKAAGLSRMHFAAQFRAATGYRPREYLLHRRVERAKAILSDGETSLAEAALAVGFCTQAHFSTVFKRITGETPARWRTASRSTSPSPTDQGVRTRLPFRGPRAAAPHADPAAGSHASL
ncbi:helix-turn-helix domain-containing protein [Bradyrhizobium cenepequi]